MVKGAVMNAFNEPLSIESLTLKPPREDEVVVKVHPVQLNARCWAVGCNGCCNS